MGCARSVANHLDFQSPPTEKYCVGIGDRKSHFSVILGHLARDIQSRIIMSNSFLIKTYLSILILIS